MRAAFLFVLLAGCTTAATITPTPDRPPTHEDALPKAFASIGKPCAEIDVKATYRCGPGALVGQITVPFGEIPKGAETRYTLVAANPSGYEMQDTETVAVEGTRVWTASRCRMCRMMMFAATLTDLQLASDEDLGALQIGVGLPARPLLRTSAEWTRALSSSPRWKRG